ncbi:MAG: SAM-dependent chlorinase/fluorinase [Acidobacteria bacterium]|nr:SAM-dependent chlorinase/fluorinase [Acidobacteriota bacterium]MBI3663281.1 SAM-dependent chlorinase/fluorinase [Acidobacteriota bacterium]
MAHPIITLTTDYGTSDHLVGVMKGTILKINPETTIVDISHSVMPFDILDGALTIGQAYRHFPPKTIHVVVVDPGVGSQRRPILVTGDQHYFVAPDNGVLSMVYECEPKVTVRHITAEHYFLNPVSNTFHGRDIFGPVAAWLGKNWQTPSFGEEVSDYVRFSLPKPKVANNTIKGVVLKVDNFGNLITNLTPEDVPQVVAGTNFKITVGAREIDKLAQTYAHGAPGEVLALIGSSGFLEISVNKGHAARALSMQRGAEVTIVLG